MDAKLKQLLKNICTKKPDANILIVLKLRLIDFNLKEELLILDTEFLGDSFEVKWYWDKWTKNEYYRFKANLLNKFRDVL